MNRGGKVDVPVPIECPNPKCEGSGTIPANRFGSQFVCKLCKTRFYVDSMGLKLVVGKRPAGLYDQAFLFDPYRKRPPDLIDRWQKLARRARKRWGALPEETRRAFRMGGYGLGIAMTIMLATWLSRSGPPQPKGILDRSQRAGVAFLKNDLATLDAMTTYGGGEALREWLELARPKSWSPTPPRLKANVRILAQSKQSSKATSSVVFINPQQPPPPTADQGPEEDPAPGQEEDPAAESAGESSDASETPVAEATEPGVEPESEAEAEPENQATPQPAPPPPPVYQLRLFWIYDGNEWYLDTPQMLRLVKPTDRSEIDNPTH
jgi:hypothetical protein